MRSGDNSKDKKLAGGDGGEIWEEDGTGGGAGGVGTGGGRRRRAGTELRHQRGEGEN